ncbi:phosphoenolpyruvate carboxykinase (ATP) [Mucilaginibacter sp. RS28]|uniref:Phosphoenolpyruvate carboxykinase (ATP) n=1 Tax=Mucilaginibacter straminoryzae TaxID=2932774 RepID=A0A9X1WYY6_9SPHI|nr:phosphoenolpyruvate carboxykinase (ATP) [Mucilaginibacter straminoryzae]MCJ8208227.1 phosphoenolpyruvate carboxykinase (ATP) [Mucilaginibacter straminoryzae]
MNETIIQQPDLAYLGFQEGRKFYYQQEPDELIQLVVDLGEGELDPNGLLNVDTGEFTGRSPKDRFIVRDELTDAKVWWGEVNRPFDPAAFDRLQAKLINYLQDRTFFVRDALACADVRHQLSVRVITETAYQNLFAYNLFLRPTSPIDQPEWTIIAAPGFYADAKEDQTRQHNFCIINFTKQTILIGGTGYTGEIKKAIFSALNFLLPQKGILPMHCSANSGNDGKTAVFFGLSGTGKTTLSADAGRMLIGDDEHGWDENGIFNFEGGCYAKTAYLSPEKEPLIYAALRPGALLENVCLHEDSGVANFDNLSKTENTRVSYPLHFVANAVIPSVGTIPENIFFLSCDAFGVLPPIARLTHEQALYYFMLGYTAKVAGTEFGINEPQATFSACFGQAFLPLPPKSYADLLSKKLNESKANVWLVNTGWTGGPYGIGARMNLPDTRAIIKAALNGQLNHDRYELLRPFNLQIPVHCPGVSSYILNPVNTWSTPAAYRQQAEKLKGLFNEKIVSLNGGTR